MIKQSPELVAIAERWLKALESRNNEILVGLFSSSENLRYLGTSFDEYWAGKLIRDGYPDHLKEIPAFKAKTKQIEAFETETVGWVVWLGELAFENVEEPQQVRVSWVLVLESGSWRIVNLHFSFPHENEAIAGHQHTALQNLIEAAKSETAFGTEGTFAILFTDVVGSTNLARELGDRVWAMRINRHFDVIRELVEDHGGVLVKSLGDGTMSSFPLAGEALAAAVAIQRHMTHDSDEIRLAVRAGVDAGEAIETKGDLFGSVINRAARITEAASPNQILVSQEAREAVTEKEFCFGESIPLRIKGITGTTTISPLHWELD